MKNLVCLQWPCCQHRNIFPPWDWTRYRVTVVEPLVRNSRSVDPKYWCFRFSDLFWPLYRCMHVSHHRLLLCFEFGIAIFFQFLRFLQSFCRINLLFRWAQAFRLQHRHGASVAEGMVLLTNAFRSGKFWGCKLDHNELTRIQFGRSANAILELWYDRNYKKEIESARGQGKTIWNNI